MVLPVWLWVLVVCLWLPLTAAAPRPAEIGAALNEGGAVRALVSGTRLLAPSQTRLFYEQRAFQPIWTGASGAAQYDDLLSALDGLAVHGLEPQTYHKAQIEAALDEGNGIEAEILSTDAFFAAVEALVNGAVTPRSVEPNWTLAPQTRDYSADLTVAVAANSLAEALSGLAPQGAEYLALSAALVALHNAPGDEAQRRGAQLRANLERWRWLPDDMGARHIRVNIPAFQLETRQAGAVDETHKVIVGKTSRPTPVFSASMTYVVFNPWWEVPVRIAKLDKLPQFKKSPGDVTRLGYQVLNSSGQRVDPSTINWRAYSAANFPFRLRQAPGEQNALGRVKLIFPNPHDVYLHDTPSKSLFEDAQRTFSSGCIRVEGALGLAEWALGGTPGWTRARIAETVAGGETEKVVLAEPLPVYVLYFTAVPDGEGGVRYLPDIYRRDEALIAALDGRPLAAATPVAASGLECGVSDGSSTP